MAGDEGAVERESGVEGEKEVKEGCEGTRKERRDDEQRLLCSHSPCHGVTRHTSLPTSPAQSASLLRSIRRARCFHQMSYFTDMNLYDECQ